MIYINTYLQEGDYMLRICNIVYMHKKPYKKTDFRLVFFCSKEEIL